MDSFNGSKYFLTIIDDYSRRVVTYFLKSKSDVYFAFERFKARAERFLNTKILAIRTDNGMEFINRQFSDYLEKQGIKAERTNTYTPEQNGVAERFNLTAVDAVKALLESSKLPKMFWEEALACFTYVWNRVCRKSNKTPFELFSKNKPSVAHLKIFGCVAYVGVPKQLRKKLDNRVKKGVMMGYAYHTKGYRIYLPSESKIIETINVRFDESKLAANEDLFSNNIQARKVIALPCIPDLDFLKDDCESKPQSKSAKEREHETSSKTMKCTEIKWVRKAVPRKDFTN